MAVYDIELKPKVVDDGELGKLQKKIDNISSKDVKINFGIRLKSNVKDSLEFEKLIKAAEQIKNVESDDKTVSLNIDTTQAGESLDDILAKLKAIRADAEKNIALNFSVNNTGETNPEKIKTIVETAKEVSALRSGNKNITLAVDIGKVGEQVKQALALVQSKIASNVPMITSNIGVNSDSVANELDKAAGKSVSFNLDVNTQINAQGLQSLMDQVDRIVALTPDQITKTVALKVNVDNFVQEVQEALAILNSINPDLMTSSQAINDRFDKYFNNYRKQSQIYDETIRKFNDDFPKFNTSEFNNMFESANKQATQLHNTIVLIRNLVKNNDFLQETRWDEIADLPTKKERTKKFEDARKDLFSVYSNEVKEGSGEYNELKNKFEQLFNFNPDSSKLTENLDELTDGVRGVTKSTQSSLEIIRQIDSMMTRLTNKIEKMQEYLNPLIGTMGQSASNLGQVVSKISGYMEQTQQDSLNPLLNKIQDLNKDVQHSNESLATMATNIKAVSDTITKITSPFDIKQFADTSRMLEGVKKAYQEVIDTYSDVKLKLTVETNAGETLANAKQNVEAMIAAQKNFEKWLGQYQKRNPSDEGAVANAAGAQAVVQALSQYNELLSGDNKEVPITFTQTGLFEIIEAYRELVDKIVRVEFELTNYDTVQNAIDKLDEAGAINKSGASATPPSNFTLDPEALTGIKGGIDDVVSRLDSIISVLPAPKEQATQTDSLDLSKIEGILEGISGAISQSSETKSEPVTKGFVGGIHTEMRGRIQGIVSLLETIEAKFEVRSATNNKQGEDTVTNSLLDGILKSLDQSSVYVNNINGNLEKLLTPKKSKENTKNSDANKIIKAITSLQGLVKQKTDKLPDRLVSISKTNSSISTNTRNTQSNTGTASRNISSMYKSLGSKADNMVSQLSAINTKLQQGATIGANNPDSLNNANADNLTKALNGLASILAMQQSQDDEERKRRGLLPIAGMMPNVTQQTNLQTQSNDRIKEYKNVLKFIGNRNLDSVFGSKNKIETYINALKTLNNEIANATKTLNTNDATKAQRKEAQERIANSSKSLQAILNGNDALGIDPDKIANIKQLLTTLNSLNTSIGNVDQALPNIEKLQSALKTYDVSVDPINNAVKGLTDVRRKLGNMMTELNSENLDADMIKSVQTRLTQTQTEINTLLTQSNQILDTNNADSFKSVSKGFLEAESEIKKYKSQVESLKKLLQDLKDKNVNLATINMGNGRSAKDMEAFITQYENFLNTSKTIATPADMQTFATNFQANYQTPLRQYIQGLTEARHQFTQLQQAAKESSDPRSIAKSVEDLTARMIKWKQANNQAFKIDDYARQYNKIFTELTSSTISSREVIKKLQTDFAHLNRQVVQAGYNTKNFTTKLKEMFKKYGGWTLVTKTMNIAMRLIRSMVTQVKELDTSMTNLRKVTEATGNQLNTFLESAGKRSVALGASLTDYVDAVSEFSRLGKSLDEAQKLGELATTYKTVAEDLDIKTASKSIISTMQAFNSVGVQADEIVDKFNYVGKMLPLITISVKVRRRIRPR